MNLDHWEAYYRGGAIVSCPTSADPNYSREVRQAWVDFFSGLPDGASILDLGCGNGPVALIAKETAEELSRRFQIDAVDLAEIDPPANVPDGASLFDGIRFHSRVSTEDLPFETASMDAVCGQYIVEYTNIAQTLAEAARVLRPGGACQFILHHVDSVVVQNARESLQQAEFALGELKVMRLFRRYTEKAGQSPTGAGSSQRALADAGTRLQRAAREAANPLFLEFLINAINGLLSHQARMSRGALLRQTNRLERELKNWIRRLEDLASGARSKDDMERITADAQKAGFGSVSVTKQMQDDDMLVGWRLAMTRSG